MGDEQDRKDEVGPPEGLSGDAVDGQEKEQIDPVSPRPLETLAMRTKRHWVASVRKVFNQFDEDASGSIDTSEFGQVLEAAGLNVREDVLAVLIKEFDANGDGTVDFEEFVQFLEKHGMGPDGTTGGGVCALSDALKTMNQQVKSTMMDLSAEEHNKIVEKATALCPKQHGLEKMTLEELNLEKFYYGLDGFVCGKCTIHSSSLVNQAAYLCSKCQYVLCSMCAGIVKEEVIQSEISGKMNAKRSQLWACSDTAQKSAKETLVNRKKRGPSTKLHFSSGMLRASVTTAENMSSDQ